MFHNRLQASKSLVQQVLFSRIRLYLNIAHTAVYNAHTRIPFYRRNHSATSNADLWHACTHDMCHTGTHNVFYSCTHDMCPACTHDMYHSCTHDLYPACTWDLYHAYMYDLCYACTHNFLTVKRAFAATATSVNNRLVSDSEYRSRVEHLIRQSCNKHNELTKQAAMGTSSSFNRVVLSEMKPLYSLSLKCFITSDSIFCQCRQKYVLYAMCQEALLCKNGNFTCIHVNFFGA